MTEEKKGDPNIEAIRKLIEPSWPVDESRRIVIQLHLKTLNDELN